LTAYGMRDSKGTGKFNKNAVAPWNRHSLLWPAITGSRFHGAAGYPAQVSGGPISFRQ
jgi:hypothetical protein